MHETKLMNCVFGCAGCLDTHQHYLVVVGKCPFDGFLSHLCLVNCSVLSAARLVVACLIYHSVKNSYLPFVRCLSAQGELDELGVVVLFSALLLKFVSTSCIGPRRLWPKRFAQTSVTSNVLVEVLVEPLARGVRGFVKAPRTSRILDREHILPLVLDVESNHLHEIRRIRPPWQPDSVARRASEVKLSLGTSMSVVAELIAAYEVMRTVA